MNSPGLATTEAPILGRAPHLPRGRGRVSVGLGVVGNGIQACLDPGMAQDSHLAKYMDALRRLDTPSACRASLTLRTLRCAS